MSAKNDAEELAGHIESTKEEKKENIEDLVDYKFDREFIFGPLKNANDDFKDIDFNYCATPVCRDFFLFARPPTNITLYGDDENYGGLITALNCDNDLINIGAPYRSENDKPLIIKSLNENEFLYFKKIICQYVYFYSGAYDGWFAGINYICFTDRNGNKFEKGKLIDTQSCDKDYVEKEVIAFGEKNNFGAEDRKVKAYYFKPVTERGNLYITGVAFCLKGLLFLQIADIRDSCTSIDSLLNAYHFTDNQGVYEANNINTSYDATVYGHLIGCEDYNVLTTWHTLYVTGCGSIGVADPRPYIIGKFLLIIENSLVNGDLETMHSVFSIERFLDHVIQTKFKSTQIELKEDGINDGIIAKSFNGGFGYRFITKSRIYWYQLYKVIKTIKKIHFYTPSFDCYILAFLKPTTFNKLQALFIFITQIALFIMVISSLEYDISIIFDFDHHSDSFIIAILVCFMVFFLAKQQINSTIGFIKTFDGSIKSWIVILSIIINIIVGVLMIPLNFIIMASTKDRFDLILNSVAVLFILELDNQIIDLNPNDENAIYLAYLQKHLQQYFQQIDDKSHKVNTWKERATVDHVNCQFDWE